MITTAWVVKAINGCRGQLQLVLSAGAEHILASLADLKGFWEAFCGLSKHRARWSITWRRSWTWCMVCVGQANTDLQFGAATICGAVPERGVKLVPWLVWRKPYESRWNWSFVSNLRVGIVKGRRPAMGPGEDPKVVNNHGRERKRNRQMGTRDENWLVIAFRVEYIDDGKEKGEFTLCPILLVGRANGACF